LVLLAGAGKKVVGVYARRHIAPMADNHAIGDGADIEHVGQTVCALIFAVNA
jgi:hypothetical protein